MKFINKRQIMDEKSKVDISLVIDALLSNIDVRSANDKLYIWDPELGCYKRPGNEKREILRLFENSCHNLLSSQQIDEILKRLKQLPSTEIDADELDHDAFAINCRNGVVNLKTLKLLPKDKAYKFTNCLDFDFLPDAKFEEAPHFKAYTKTSLVGDETKMKLLLQMIGYVISNNFSLKCACFLVGAPDCGKSHVIALISKTFGQENITNLTLSDLGKRFSTSHLAFTRLNVNGDLETDTLSNIAEFKRILGGDRLFAEFKGKDGFMFIPRTHLLYGCNNLPGLKEVQSSSAYINRVIALNFPVSIPKERQDPELAEKLWMERDIIFSLAVKEFSELIRGNRQFTIDEDSQQTVQNYKDQLDPVSAFVREACILTEDGKIHKFSFYRAFKLWCEENGVNHGLSQDDVSKLILKNSKITSQKLRIAGSKPLAGFKGISLRTDTDEG